MTHRAEHQVGPASVPSCAYRQLTHDPQQFYCHHALVHSAGNLVTPDICRVCTARHRECPNRCADRTTKDLLLRGLRSRDPKAMVRLRFLSEETVSLPATSAVTIGVTAFNRPASLHRLLVSLTQHYPNVHTIVVDTGDEPLQDVPEAVTYVRRADLYGNLSAARNALVQLAETEFVWILEDDFELADADALVALLDVLAGEPQLGVVAGRLIEDGTPRDGVGDLRRFRDTLEVTQPPDSRWLATARGTLYRCCDMVLNFFVARREVLLENPWDEDLPLLEHAAWFLKLQQQARWGVAFTPAASVIHHRDRPSDQYRRARARTNQLQPVLEAKYGFSSLSTALNDRQLRPNVLVLGVGYHHTSITTKQLFELGWCAGDADQQFAESRLVRGVNERLLKTGEFPVRDAYNALVQLPQPWALTDPRFADTLDRWLALLVGYEPLLLWLPVDLETVLNYYRRRGELVECEDAVRRRLENCRRYYEMWPWGKLSISAEDIAEALAVFDLEIAHIGECGGVTGDDAEQDR